MSTKSERDRQKQIQDRCLNLLSQMLRDDDNKYCVDCDAKGPRWASWNLGIFLCIRCAGIHRNLGVHISKVKSVNLDTWTPEQVVSLQQMGNSRARAVYEANLQDSFRRPQTDSALEAFIRAKYEAKKYIAKEWVPPPMPKVNWDKELEEEEKSKRKKREGKTGIIPAAPMVRKVDNMIPQPLPKPSTSPKTQRYASPSQARHKLISQNTDLLSLDTPGSEGHPVVSTTNSGNDGFINFLSSSTSSSQYNNQQSTSASTSRRSQEEESFFNQPQISGISQDKKLTTDYILGLYGKSLALQTANPSAYQGTAQLMGQIPPMPPGPGQMFQTPPPMGYQLPNGTHAPSQRPYSQSVFGGVGSNPFYNMASQQELQFYNKDSQQVNYQLASRVGGLSLNSGANSMVSGANQPMVVNQVNAQHPNVQAAVPRVWQ